MFCRNKRISLMLCFLLLASLLCRTVTAGEISTNDIKGWPEGPEIPAESAYVSEISTDTVLYAKNADEALFPSSSVKIMTCLLALENTSLDDEVVMTETGAAGVTDGGAHIASQIDEVFTVEQCLYAIMLASANDVALQLAEYVGGTVEDFVAMMNKKAQELGCTDTLFTNPTGLPDPDQHTTAHDLALITKAAFANKDFKEIASATTYTIPATNMSGGERVLSNKFTMIDPGSDAYYADCIGGKEGYTEASGSVLSCAAVRDDMPLVCVVMMGQADMTDDQAIQLLDYAYDSFEMRDLGRDDFYVDEGGIVVVPKDIGTSDIEVTDEPLENGRLDRTYSVGGAVVGKAVAIIPEEVDNSVTEESEEHLKEAASKSHAANFPYVLIAGVGILIFLFLIRKLKSVLSS